MSPQAIEQQRQTIRSVMDRIGNDREAALDFLRSAGLIKDEK